MGEPETPAAGRREWVGLAVLALACLLYSMDLTVLHLAVPALSADLRPSGTELLWIVDIYGFMVAGALITMGTLGDRIGRRRLLMIGAAAFAAASLLAAFSTSPGMLIAARAVLGLAGATLAPGTLSLIRTMFQRSDQRRVAIGVWITAFSVGGAIGPLAGGVLLEFFWWGSVFLLALPVMAVLLLVGPRLLPEYRDPDAGRVDLPSAALSLAAVLALVYAVKHGSADGLDAATGGACVAGLLLGAVFLRRQRRLADPLVDLRLFRLPAFSAALATYTLGILVMGASFLFITQYLQLVRGQSPLLAGVWLLPSALGFIVGAMASPPLARRMRPAWAMAGGMLLGAVGLGMLVLVSPTGGLAWLVAGSTLSSIGLGPVITLATDLVVGAAPPERAGAAAGISETGAELGGSVGIAVLGSVGTAVYRDRVADHVPADVPRRAADAARDTLGAAVDQARGLAGPAAQDLLATARDAFTHALQVTSAIAAIAAAAAAVLAGVMLWRVQLPPDHETPVVLGDAPAVAAPASELAR